VKTSPIHRMNTRESTQRVADPTVLRATGVVALLAIGTIHFLQIIPTVEQTPLLGVGYIGLIAASVVVAAWLVVTNDMRAWVAAGLLSAAVLVGTPSRASSAQPSTAKTSATGRACWASPPSSWRYRCSS